MPIDLRVVTGAASATTTVWNTAVNQDFALPPTASAPTSVQLDPQGWVLKSAITMTLSDGDADGVPDSADNCPAGFNPAQEDLDGDMLGDACDPDIDGDQRPNGSDCAPADPSAQDPPTEVTGLQVSGGAVCSLVWDPDPAQGAGLLFEVLRVDASSLVPNAGVGSAGCRELGLDVPLFAEVSQPSAGDAFCFLVRKRNACGSGSLGLGSDGSQRTSTACP